MREKKYFSWKNIFIGILPFFLTLFAVIWAFNSKYSFASVFLHSAQSTLVSHFSSTDEEEFLDFVIADTATVPGEMGEIAITSTRDRENISGFSFRLFAPSSDLEIKNITLDGTAIEKKDFFLQKKIFSSGEIYINATSAGEGIDCKKGEALIKVHFALSADASPLSPIVIQGGTLSIVNTDLTVNSSTIADGKVFARKNEESSQETFHAAAQTQQIKIFSPESYSSPVRVPNDNATELSLFALVGDKNGPHNIKKVTADLRALEGIAEQPMIRGERIGNNQYFYIEGLKIPQTVGTRSAPYFIPVNAESYSGDMASGVISVIVTNDVISSVTPKIKKFSVSRSTLTKENISDPLTFFAEIFDEDGDDNIQTVALDFSRLGLETVFMESKNTGNAESKTWFFEKNDIVFPDTLSAGVYTVRLIVIDKTGEESREELTLAIEMGNVPEIISQKSYSTPSSIIPDGKTPFAAYVFVKDVDKDLSHVILQLGNYATFVGADLPEETIIGTNGEEECISTRSLLCMKPILKEDDGQWFYVDQMVVNKGIPGGNEPYHLPVVAVDKHGKITKGTFPLFVGDMASFEHRSFPYFRFAQSVSSQQVQMILSAPVHPESVKKEHFSISLFSDKNNKLPVYGVHVSADGRIITLRTAGQTIGEKYFISVDTQKLGLRSERQSDKNIPFEGFDWNQQTKNLRVTEVKATSPETIVLHFNQPLNALSLSDKNNIKIIPFRERIPLAVHDIWLIAPNILEVRTAEQTPGKEYSVSYSGFLSLTGEKIESRHRKTIDAFSVSLVDSLESLHHRADFNGDRVVDFKDFTLFSTVYGKQYDDIALLGDFNNDTLVDFYDFTLFSTQYGQNAPVHSSLILNPASSTGTGSGGTGGNASAYGNTAFYFDDYGDAVAR
jgi:hypothetical protein